MSENPSIQPVSLEAESPYILRKNRSTMSEADMQAARRSGDMGFLHSFTTGSTVDGPGVRVVGWTTGCQFRCLYCHNPDTWHLNNGIPVTLTKAIEELRKYRTGLKMMSGGFTLSGGEPLIQDRFAARLFAEVKAMGIHTALDTNGSLGGRLTDAELDKIDLVLLDIKSWDAERHRRLTGHEIGPVLDFARRLAVLKKPVWLRFVLVPGYTDIPEDVEQIAKFTASLGNTERVDVLPFHQMGRFKWQELKLSYMLDDVKPPSPEVVERVCKLFRDAGLNTY